MLDHTFQDPFYQQARGEVVYQDVVPGFLQCIDHQMCKPSSFALIQ